MLDSGSPSTLTRRFAPPSPSGRGTILKTIPLPLGEGGAKRRVRVEGLPPSLSPHERGEILNERLLLCGGDACSGADHSRDDVGPFLSRHSLSNSSLKVMTLRATALEYRSAFCIRQLLRWS